MRSTIATRVLRISTESAVSQSHPKTSCRRQARSWSVITLNRPLMPWKRQSGCTQARRLANKKNTRSQIIRVIVRLHLAHC
jgi:hypothetical protein